MVIAIATAIPKINASLSGFGVMSSLLGRIDVAVATVEGDRERFCDPRHISVV